MQKKTIHRYEIIEKIGEGGMGVVYKARDPRIDRIVAIKTIKFGTSDDAFDVEEKKKRFYREAKTSGQLFHQNIVTILDVDEFEDFSYIVMEYVEGETLARRLRGGQPLNQLDSIQFISQVCSALHYAHGMGIVHRDIKPSNIMLVGEIQIKVADFGLAKMLTSTSANITKTGGVVGTPFYMAPEQIRGELTDGRVDIFALGVVLYECVTGAKPFVGDSISTIIYKILHEDPVCIREFNRDLSPTLDTIIQKALAKKIEERYQNARQMGEDLKEFLHQEKMLKDKTASLAKTPSGKIDLHLGNLTYSIDKVDVVEDVSEPSGKTKLKPKSSPQTLHIDQKEASPQLLPAKSKSKWVLLGIVLFGLIIAGFLGQPYLADYLQHSSQLTVQNQKTPELDAVTQSVTPGVGTDALPQLTPTAALLQPTQPAVREAFYSVLVEPAGASILLDGEELGNAPLSVQKIKSGEYTVDVHFEGYQSESRSVTIDGSANNPTALEFTLKPKMAQVRFTTNPKRAQVLINNKSYGRTPLKNIALAPGRYSVTLKRTNYRNLTFDLDLKPGQVLPLSKKLQPAGRGELIINAQPFAYIYLDGQKFETPFSKKIPSGVHTLKLTHPKYPPFEDVIEMPVGETYTVVHDFEKANFGEMQVNSDPWGNVYVDDQYIDATPVTTRVRVGKHKVKISREGFVDQEFDVEVQGGKKSFVNAELESTSSGE